LKISLFNILISVKIFIPETSLHVLTNQTAENKRQK